MSPTIFRTGSYTLHAEVSGITPHGFWVFVESGTDTHEYFVPFEAYPGFRRATVAQICAVEQPSPQHLYWPELDEDIETEALEHPERYPLVSRRSQALA